MEPNQFLGLLKFFRDEDHLDQLISGIFYCNTPEYYRQSDQAGIADKHESCIHAYRKKRGDEPYEILINGQIINGLKNFTIHGGKLRASWLHCWIALEMPDSEESIDELAMDLARARNEFGSHYAFIPAHKLPPFIARLKSIIPFKMDSFKVAYSEDGLKWSVGCKSERYRYQRESRFMVGERELRGIEHKRFIDITGFSDYILKCPEVKVVDGKSGHTWFSINSETLIVCNQSSKTAPKNRAL